jgi:hypothetical protein
MVKRCVRDEAPFGVVLIRQGEEVGPADFHDVGTLARIIDFNTLPDGLLGLTCTGGERFRVLARALRDDGLNFGQVRLFDPDVPISLPAEFRHLADLLERLLPELGDWYVSLERQLDDAHWVGYRLAEILPLSMASRQFCLELEDARERLRLLSGVLGKESLA